MGSPLNSIPDTAGLGKVFFAVEVHKLIRVHTVLGSTSLSKSLIISGPYCWTKLVQSALMVDGIKSHTLSRACSMAACNKNL